VAINVALSLRGFHFTYTGFTVPLRFIAVEYNSQLPFGPRLKGSLRKDTQERIHPGWRGPFGQTRWNNLSSKKEWVQSRQIVKRFEQYLVPYSSKAADGLTGNAKE